MSCGTGRCSFQFYFIGELNINDKINDTLRTCTHDSWREFGSILATLQLVPLSLCPFRKKTHCDKVWRCNFLPSKCWRACSETVYREAKVARLKTGIDSGNTRQLFVNENPGRDNASLGDAENRENSLRCLHSWQEGKAFSPMGLEFALTECQGAA